MKVTLAYPYEIDGTKHEPDKSVEVSDELAAQLIRDGRARAYEGKTTSSKKEA